MAWHDPEAAQSGNAVELVGSNGQPAAVNGGSSASPDGKAGSGAAAAAEAGAADGEEAAAHWWEDEVFPEQRMPEHCRAGLSYRGLSADPRQPHNKPPLLLAAVRGTDHEGRPFRWVARRQRKRLLHPHQCAEPAPRLAWAAALDARRQAANLSWWVAALFTLGSLLFVISGIAGIIRPSAQPQRQPPGLASLNAGLIGWPNAVAANLLFFPAGVMQLVECADMSLRCRLKGWEARGQRGPRPRRTLLPDAAQLRTISWWATAIQVAGMLGFNMATLATLVSTGTVLAPSVTEWCINFGFTWGGAAFTVSGALFACEATGSWWRGLVPSRLLDLRSISWHSVFWGFHGGAGFLISGAATYATQFSWTQQQWIFGYGALGGAVWFELSALAMLLEQANPGHM